MLIQKLGDVLRAALIGSLLFAFCNWAVAQDQAPAAGKPSTKKGKTSADTCDGALDIVPVKPRTFTRKRRPAKTEQASPADAKDAKDAKGAKPENNQKGES
jgi:hypothetical protein